MLPFGENWGKGPWDLCIIFTTSCESTVISKFLPGVVYWGSFFKKINLIYSYAIYLSFALDRSIQRTRKIKIRCGRQPNARAVMAVETPKSGHLRSTL